MRRTLRLTFGKRLTGAIAVFALASLAMIASGQSQQSAKDQKDRKDQVEAKFYHENTPPPVSIDEGSLRILVPGNRPLAQPSPGPRPRYVYTGDFRPSPTPSPASNEIAQIRILQGNGDTIYSNSPATGSWIKLELQNSNGQPAGDIKIRGGANFVVDSDAPLTSPTTGGGHLKHSYHHPGGGAMQFRVKSIKVTIGDPDSAQSPIRFHIDLGPVIPPFQSQEYRVLIWLH